MKTDQQNRNLRSQMIKACENYDLVIEKMHKVIKGLKAHPKVLTKPEHKYLRPVFDKVLFNTLSNLDLITELKYLDLSNLARNHFEMNFLPVLLLSRVLTFSTTQTGLSARR